MCTSLQKSVSLSTKILSSSIDKSYQASFLTLSYFLAKGEIKMDWRQSEFFCVYFHCGKDIEYFAHVCSPWSLVFSLLLSGYQMLSGSWDKHKWMLCRLLFRRYRLHLLCDLSIVNKNTLSHSNLWIYSFLMLSSCSHFCPPPSHFPSETLSRIMRNSHLGDISVICLARKLLTANCSVFETHSQCK